MANRKNKLTSIRLTPATISNLNYIKKKHFQEYGEEIFQSQILEMAIRKYATIMATSEEGIQDITTMIDLIPSMIKKSLENETQNIQYQLENLNEKFDFLTEYQIQLQLFIARLISKLNIQFEKLIEDDEEFEKLMEHRLSNILRSKIKEQTSNYIFNNQMDMDDLL